MASFPWRDSSLRTFNSLSTSSASLLHNSTSSFRICNSWLSVCSSSLENFSCSLMAVINSCKLASISRLFSSMFSIIVWIFSSIASLSLCNLFNLFSLSAFFASMTSTSLSLRSITSFNFFSSVLSFIFLSQWSFQASFPPSSSCKNVFFSFNKSSNSSICRRFSFSLTFLATRDLSFSRSYFSNSSGVKGCNILFRRFSVWRRLSCSSRRLSSKFSSDCSERLFVSSFSRVAVEESVLSLPYLSFLKGLSFDLPPNFLSAINLSRVLPSLLESCASLSSSISPLFCFLLANDKGNRVPLLSFSFS